MMWRQGVLAAALVALLAVPARSTGSTAPTTACAPGVHRLTLGGGRTATMRVTPGDASERRALLLVLHDSRGTPADALRDFRGGWSTRGLILLAPDARGSSWSFERGRGDDLRAVDQALTQAFARCPVDESRVGIAGFSDGATAALSLGITNGRLFRAIVALSPGRIDPQRRVGKPRIYVADGMRDVVSQLRSEGYEVTFRGIASGHGIPSSVSRAAVSWFLR